jgi:large subunit ribosomal protein L24
MLKLKKLPASAQVTKAHVKKNDTVMVIAGKDRGKRGKVLRVMKSQGTAVVERINFMKKHARANPQKNVKGGVLEREAPIRLTNLMVVCPSCSEASRFGRKATAEGSVRYCKNCNTETAE